MTNLSGPSRKRLSELGLDAWRSRGAFNGNDEEAGRSVGGSSSAGGGGGGEGSVGRDGSRGPALVKFAEEGAVAGGGGGTPRGRAAPKPQPGAEESLRSHYSASPAHSHASGSPG